MKRIYFIRHGQSEANVDLTKYHEKPDHAISLTEKGKAEALATGAFLKQHFKELEKQLGYMPKIRLWNSPYLRTRQTAEGIMHHCKDIFHDQREDTMLVEQQFGIFDGLTDEEQAQRYPIEFNMLQHAHKFQGKYWAKFPHGESPFDVDQRTKHMQGTFARDSEKHSIEYIVVVSHGVTTRVMAMRYLRQSFEDYSNEKNPSNASVRLLQKENNTWVDKRYIFAP